jgi:hypothetical protein
MKVIPEIHRRTKLDICFYCSIPTVSRRLVAINCISLNSRVHDFI